MSGAHRAPERPSRAFLATLAMGVIVALFFLALAT